MSAPASLRLVRAPRAAPLVARLAFADDGRTPARGGIAVAVALIVLAVVMHLLAYHLIGASAPSGIDPDRTTLILVTGCALLSWSLTLSQAMEW